MDARRFPLRVAFAVATVSAALLPTSARAADLTGEAPDVVRPLQKAMRVSLSGAGAFSALETPRVWVDGVERTALADVKVVDESASDFDGDGVVDETRVAYDVSLDALELAVGQLLEVDVGAATSAGPRRFRTASRVAPHLDVRISDHVVFGPEVPVYVEWRELALAESALIVSLGGHDVTRWVGVGAPELVLDESKNGFTSQRIEHYALDLSALAGRGLEGLPLSVSVFGGTLDGRVTSVAATSVGTGSGFAKSGDGDTTDPCHAQALADFCKALGLAKAANGSVTSTADAKAQKAAADALQAALAACEIPFPQTKQTFDCNGVKVTIVVETNGDKATLTEKGDAVIVIAGDGNGSGSGGAATATNTQPGGIAIAVGGDGGSGSSSGGNGGSGTASGTCGPNGSPAGGAAGIGGNGGTPSNPSNNGGNGGAGSATTAPPSTNAGAGGSNGSAGQGGGGGWGSVSNNQGSSGHF